MITNQLHDLHATGARARIICQLVFEGTKIFKAFLLLFYQKTNFGLKPRPSERRARQRDSLGGDSNPSQKLFVTAVGWI